MFIISWLPIAQEQSEERRVPTRRMRELVECVARRLGLSRTEAWSIEEARKSLAAAPQLAQNMLISAARAREQLR
jgi:hypothetical protein